MEVLFDAIRNNDSIEGDWYLNLYDNKNAFYRLKNRLIEEVERSLVMLKSHEDLAYKIQSYLLLAKSFSNKNNNGLAMKYYSKAEKLCIDSENTSLLRVVYEEIISLCSTYSEVNPIHYINLLNALEVENNELRDLNRLTASINYKLRQSNFSGKDELLLKELQEIIERLNLDQTFISNHKVQLKINEVVRNILLQQKDFKGLALFLENSLSRFQEEKIFDRQNHDKKIIMLTWLVNSLSKLKRFEEAIQTTNELHKALKQYDRLHYDRFIWTYYQSLVINYTYSGKLDQAIEILDEILATKKFKGELFYDLFIYLNLTTLHFCKQEYSNSLKYLQHIIIKEVYDRMENAMKLNVSIVEVIIHFEKKNLDFVLFKITEIRKKFKLLLKEDYYKKEQLFLKIMKEMVKYYPKCNHPKLELKLDQFKELFLEHEIGSNEAINYVSYLESKIKDEDYYQLLLNQIQK